MGNLTEGGAGETFPSGPSAEERKAEAQEAVKEQLLQEYWEKSGGQPTPPPASGN